VYLRELSKRQSTFTLHTRDTKEDFQLNPFQKLDDKNYMNGIHNNREKQEKEFTLKMKERRLKINEVCSKFYKTSNKR